MDKFAFNTVMMGSLQKFQRHSLKVPNDLSGLEESQNHSFFPYFE